ncbi:MAG TPA: T9SS type A sorting domain-containing protein, partial [Bacteroidales bacterium]|nr:T9SS type A sorting domain-containing protein [Bacteroidales bacterium]
RFNSDDFVQEQGMYIDDLEISINGIGIHEKTSDQPIDFRINPNPATDLLRIDYTLESAGSVEILIADLKGTTVSVLDNSYREKGDHFIHTSLEPLPAGSYMVILRHSGKQSSRKLIITE